MYISWEILFFLVHQIPVLHSDKISDVGFKLHNFPSICCCFHIKPVSVHGDQNGDYLNAVYYFVEWTLKKQYKFSNYFLNKQYSSLTTFC